MAVEIQCISTPSKAMKEDDLRAVANTWSEAFPTAAGRDRFAEAIARRDQEESDSFSEEWVHYILSDGLCLAACRTFVRLVTFDDKPRRILALAHVASLPSSRGKGLGVHAVREAFKTRLNDDIQECFFCTGIPNYYTKNFNAELLPSSLQLEYPPGAKPFHDTALLRIAHGAPDPISPTARFYVNGDGW